MSETADASERRTHLRPGERFLGRSEVEAMTGYKKSTIYAMMPRGEFPAQRQIGPNRVVWLESEIRAWMAARLAA